MPQSERGHADAAQEPDAKALDDSRRCRHFALARQRRGRLHWPANAVAALAERRDFLDMTQHEQLNLTAKVLAFNAPDTTPFREALAKRGFYRDMEKFAGDHAWSLLEKYVGPLTS
jgi:hypothetical protein